MTKPPPPVLEFSKVTKVYARGMFGRDRLRALDAVTLRIEAGATFALVGPNRAGKTTLVKLLLSLCQPTHGAISRFGVPSADRQTLGRVGYVHENQAFPRYLTARSLLEFYAALAFVSEPTVRERAPKLLERVGLADRADEPIARFSKGMVQRLGIAQALLHEPDLLVLDEPSEGLDLIGRQLVRELVREHQARGKTIIFVSHVLSEVELLCDRVGILAAGRLEFVGPMAQLCRDAAGAPVSLEVAVRPYYEGRVPAAL
jgi:ABC-2 type transport system ATP-binding protein